jgi:hypothetical protein
MKHARAAAAMASVWLASSAGAVNVYVLSSGDAPTDSAVMATLSAHGHTPTLGVPYTGFDGTQSLAGFHTVYFQANANWGLGDMPAAGQQVIVDFVALGGRLVTSEWVVWKVAAAAQLQTIGPILATEPASTYGATLSATYIQVTANSAINAGLPASLTFPLNNYAGTETLAGARAGATTYYSSNTATGIAGLTGWNRGNGSVFCFSTTCGPDQLADVNFGRLFSNVMGATATGSCYANCDASTVSPVLNVNDFTCFLNRFAAGNSYANCDASTIVPTLNINDFICFNNRFAGGCP